MQTFMYFGPKNKYENISAIESMGIWDGGIRAKLQEIIKIPVILGITMQKL